MVSSVLVIDNDVAELTPTSVRDPPFPSLMIIDSLVYLSSSTTM